MNDLRFAFRQLLKKPGFTAVAILTIALSIGANTTVYSWIKATLVNLLPEVVDQQRLIVICPRHSGGTISDTCSYPDIQDFAQLTNVFAGVTGSQIGLANVRRRLNLLYGNNHQLDIIKDNNRFTVKLEIQLL